MIPPSALSWGEVVHGYEGKFLYYFQKANDTGVSFVARAIVREENESSLFFYLSAGSDLPPSCMVVNNTSGQESKGPRNSSI